MSLETKHLLKASQLHYCPHDDAKSMVKHLIFLRKFAVITILRGSSIRISCVSSFPPPWTWYSRKDGTIKRLSATGTKPHPKLNEPRYEFYEKDGEYILEITNVAKTDAGKFICDGDSRDSTTLNVIR